MSVFLFDNWVEEPGAKRRKAEPFLVWSKRFTISLNPIKAHFKKTGPVRINSANKVINLPKIDINFMLILALISHPIRNIIAKLFRHCTGDCRGLFTLSKSECGSNVLL